MGNCKGASQVAQWARICLPSRRCRLDPWVGKIPWRKKWQPIPVFLPGKSHGQRSLVGNCPLGHKRVRHNLATQRQQQIYRMYNELMEIHQKRGENPKYKVRQRIGTES